MTRLMNIVTWSHIRLSKQMQRHKFASQTPDKPEKIDEVLRRVHLANENTPRTADNTNATATIILCFGIIAGIAQHAQMQVRKGDTPPCASQSKE